MNTYWDDVLNTARSTFSGIEDWDFSAYVKHAEHDLNDSIDSLHMAETNVRAWKPVLAGQAGLLADLLTELERAELVVSVAATRLAQAKRRATGRR